MTTNAVNGNYIFHYSATIVPRRSQSPTHLVAATAITDPTFDILGEQALFDITNHQSDMVHRRYDVTPDGQRFVMIRNVPVEDRGEDPVLVLNFFEELKAKVGRE